MNNVTVDHILSLAVWGSLTASAFLGLYMLVQSWDDAERRKRFVLFGLICAVVTGVDFSYSYHLFDHWTYERIRIVVWAAHAAALLNLFRYRRRIVISPLLALPTLAALTWLYWNKALATSMVVPWSFLIAAIAHGQQYWRARGYASCVLCVQSLTLALMCSLYFPVLLTADGRIIGLGYLHYAANSFMAVFFGWVNLPRELRGKAPVRVNLRHASAYAVTVLLLEAGVQLALLKYFAWPPYLYITCSGLQIAATLLLFLYHRQRLVIYTDNVTQLLEERTTSLRRAQEELARLNSLQAEKLKEQARELESKSQVIERQRRLELAAHTAGQAAHDIQNLIAPMVVHLEQLYEKNTETPRRDSVSLLQRQMHELLELNGQLLALARRGRLELLPLNMTELLHDLKPRFPGDKVVFQAAPAVWTRGSWSQLARALSNLITNALEAASAADCQVVVRCFPQTIRETKQCHLGFLAPGDYVLIEVEDNGPGIPGEILDRIFEPFFSSKTRGTTSGSGLGLGIVAAVVDDHKGVLDLQTSSGGTRFQLYLPLGAAAENQNDISRLSQNVTVLVIDDDSSTLHDFEKILAASGCSVITAVSRHEALRVLQLEQVQVLLIDMRLGDSSGLDVLFSAIHLRPGVRSIICTSYLSDQEERRARELGACAILTKPIGAKQLIQAVADALTDLPLAAAV